MQFAAALNQDRRVDEAVSQALGQLKHALPHSCDLAVVFVSSLYKTDWQPVLAEIRQALDHPVLIGCTGSGVLGGQDEVEFTPAVALVGAHLPEVTLHAFHVRPSELTPTPPPGYWIEKLGPTPAEAPIGLLLPDPYTCDATTLIAGLNSAYAGMPLVGGLASSTTGPEDLALFLNQDVLHDGAVGVLLSGNIRMETLVAQGCRPIGRPCIITKAAANVIQELAGVPAVEVLRRLLSTLSPGDRLLAQRALFVGVVMNEQKAAFGCGDFLVRNLVAIDPDSGAIAVGEQISVGQTVQFQLRDARTSREDLAQLLAIREQAPSLPPIAGALLFNCLGRGKDLYGEPSYDTRTIQASLGQLPLAGFFSNGEIGPVGGRNFIHGFTSSLGLFGPKS
jgi:small ligand-binding sensory domain FIST